MKIAHFMVWAVGMGKSGLIGNFQEALYLHNQQDQPLLSEQMKAKLDNETQDILQQCLKETEEILKRESQVLDAITEALLEKEDLTYPEIHELFNKYAKEKPAHRSTTNGQQT
jgi:ATP-dependent Zn protease